MRNLEKIELGTVFSAHATLGFQYLFPCLSHKMYYPGRLLIFQIKLKNDHIYLIAEYQNTLL